MTRLHILSALVIAALTSCGSDPAYDPVAAQQSMDAMRLYITREISDPDRRDPLLHLMSAYEDEVLALNREIAKALYALAELNADPAATREQFSALFESTLRIRDAHLGALLDVLQDIRNRTNDREWAGIAQLEAEAFQANIDRELPYFRGTKLETNS